MLSFGLMAKLCEVRIRRRSGSHWHSSNSERSPRRKQSLVALMMYLIDASDKVLALEHIPQSSVGAPLPVVLSDERKVLLAYILEDQRSDWDGATVRVVTPGTPSERLALVEFDSYSTFMFGAPNDEAFEGHPLASRGLHPYGAFEILNSSWIRQLEKMNSVHPQHRTERFERLRHFILAFHDSSFECVAESVRVSQHVGSLESLMPLMVSKLKY